MNTSAAAAIAFLALGANLLGAFLLLLLSPRSRELRWYLPFQLAIIVWLFSLAMAMHTRNWAAWGPVHFGAVHLMPVLFVCFALSEAWPARRLIALVAGVAAIAAIALATGLAGAVGDPLLGAYQIAAWGAGGALLWRRHGRRPSKAARAGREARWIAILLLLVVPGTVIAGWLLGRWYFVYVMPFITVLVLVLIFLGILRHRFYDIEVRLMRSGEIAARAAEQERLAVLGALAASVAHEVRNPLAGLQSLAQRLAEEDVDEPQRRRYGSLMLQESRRLERIVSNLLDLARRRDGPGQSGGTRLPELLDDLRLLVEGSARRAGVALELRSDAAATAAPREPLAQVLLNLLLNAVRHSPAGGCVRLEAEPDGDRVAIRVSDEGAGVPADDRERIFDAFHTGSGGTGLGLAVVRRIAAEHGWAIDVGDAPGGGAAFRLRVPAAEQAAAP
jgi:signal transduction histidine kinase